MCNIISIFPIKQMARFDINELYAFLSVISNECLVFIVFFFDCNTFVKINALIVMQILCVAEEEKAAVSDRYICAVLGERCCGVIPVTL